MMQLRPGAKPKSVEQAAQLCLRLADEPAPPELKCRAFLTALLKDWPSERTLAGPDDPRVPVWNGCPLLALEHQDVARLSLFLPATGGAGRVPLRVRLSRVRPLQKTIGGRYAHCSPRKCWHHSQLVTEACFSGPLEHSGRRRPGAGAARQQQKNCWRAGVGVCHESIGSKQVDQASACGIEPMGRAGWPGLRGS